jgi:hypothetical protein
MQNIIRAVAIACVAVWTLCPAIAQPTGSDPLAECHKVHSEVGLLIRATASSSGKKVGSLSKGEKVQLDGEELAGTGAVYPMMKKDSDGAYWVKIKAPKEGYVLYTSDDDLDYKYIVPCRK